MDLAELKAQVYEVLETVSDPEIPVLTVLDLGVIRGVEMKSATEAKITITPTYTGCPAMDTISDDIRKALSDIGVSAEIDLVISPAWTTDWISEKGLRNLEEYGIAPPEKTSASKSSLTGKAHQVRCPQCKSTNTEVVSQFGSTACKALYRCKDCLEPFDYFKCL
jgi:ring-1,2-phenylacetyl-CoA epoxidase subunit PaaD